MLGERRVLRCDERPIHDGDSAGPMAEVLLRRLGRLLDQFESLPVGFLLKSDLLQICKALYQCWDFIALVALC
jgi:hypothetical protein